MFPYVHTKRNPQYGTAISSTTLLNNDSKSESFRVAVQHFPRCTLCNYSNIAVLSRKFVPEKKPMLTQ